MTHESPPQAPARTLQIQPRLQSNPGQPIAHSNTFGISVAQGTLYLDFASVSPLELEQLAKNQDTNSSGILVLPLVPLVRLALPLETAQQLVEALSANLKDPSELHVVLEKNQ